MDTAQALAEIRAFQPSNNEPADVRAIDTLIERLGPHGQTAEAGREWIGVFERYPDASLGAPGPIVHFLEKFPDDVYLTLLTASLARQATVMTIWMAERWFRSDKLSDHDRQALLSALRTGREHPPSDEVAAAIDESLEEYGG